MRRVTVGLLVLADLGELYTWSRRRGPGLAELLGAPAGDLLPPTFDPPSALVLVIAAESPGAPLMHRGWLARAAAIVLVLVSTSAKFVGTTSHDCWTQPGSSMQYKCAGVKHSRNPD